MTGFLTLKRYFSQFGRFAIVGVLNSLVDIGMTNGLVYLFNPASVQGLFVISIVACLTATINSFFLNRTWTFQASHVKPDAATMARFFSVALITILVNTSIFLFLFSQLERHFSMSKWLLLNTAKVGAIACSSVFSFLGYKIAVFDQGSIQKFKKQFTFIDHDVDRALGWLLAAIFASAIILRGLFCLGNPDPTLVAFLSGTALLVPVMLMAYQLFGRSVALLTGWLCATHPRLIEFSCHGSLEAFYLMTYSVGVLWLMTFVRGNLWSALAWMCGIVVMAGVIIHSEVGELQFWVDRVFDMLRRLPGLLGTPAVLFAFLLPFFAHFPAHRCLWPLFLMLFAPLLFYPFLNVEPWFFLSMIIPIQIFGAAGLIAFSAYLSQRLHWKYLYQVMVGLVIAFSLAITLVRSL
jgi:putative flippase GtrA